MFIYALTAALCVALVSLIGILFFRNRTLDHSVHTYLLPVAIGVFLGVIFFELIPETLEVSHTWGPMTILFGFLGFYLLSHFLDFHHHHDTEEPNSCLHSSARKLLIGDAIHNIADGIVLASAFMISPALGVATTVGVALHEIPQEIAEFGILLRAGCTRMKATTYNLISASSILVGVSLTFLFAHTLETWEFVLTGIAAGNLLYIATADLIPELRDTHRHHFEKTFIATLIGVASIGALITYTHTLGG